MQQNKLSSVPIYINITMLLSGILHLLHVFLLVTYCDTARIAHVEVCGNYTSLSVPLRTLSAAVKNARKVNITFCASISTLDGDLKLFNKQAVYLNGYRPTKSVLRCQGKSAGINFTDVHTVMFQNFRIENCGSIQKIKKDRFSSSVLIRNSSKIVMLNTYIDKSEGLGMVILHSYAVIDIINCRFSYGRTKKSLRGGGGLYILLECFRDRRINNYCEKKSELYIVNTSFNNNVASTAGNRSYFKLSHGGGLNYNLLGGSDNNVVRVRDCTFKSNKAQNYGGGLNILINRWSSNNSIVFKNCTFHRNSAFNGGGGGTNIGYWFKHVTNILKHNKIVFINSTFTNNYSKQGGGTIVYSAIAESSDIDSNEFMFINCSWKNNRARYSSAVKLNLQNQGTYNSKGLLPKVTFKNCIFEGNRVSTLNKLMDDKLAYVHKRGSGCFGSIGYKVQFNSSMQFINNSGSALYLVFSTVVINSGNAISFIDNTGYYGGAVGLFGTSILHLHDNITLNFTNNTAIVKGGAIYQEYIDTLEYISLRKCFFHYYNPKAKNGSITSVFRNNRLINSGSMTHSESLVHGNSIYMHSLKSCESVMSLRSPFITNSNYTEYSGKVVRVIFQNSTGDEISTAGTKFKVKMNITYDFPVIPGKITDLPIEINDDFNRTVYRIYQALLKSNNSMSLDPNYVNVYYNKILLYGRPGEQGNVAFSLSSIGEEEIILPVVMLDCPPGYVSETQNGLNLCVCSTQGKQYLGISHCNQSRFQAVLKRGYWLGCSNIHDNITSTFTCEKYIVSHTCPRSFCTNGEYFLPNTSSIPELDSAICGEKRTGVLCGECRKEYSAFYHSEDLKCTYSSHCKLGWLFYLLSEILPVTVFFLMVIIWDIQLTTGAVQGFILYSQLFDTLLMTGNGQLPLEAETFTSWLALKLLLNVFNLSFFTHDQLSFCLWRNASSLDMIAFKYVTVVFAFSLILLTIAALNFCRLDRCLKKIRIRGIKRNISSSILHGLSGFLVICYSQCTKISLQILTPAVIYSTESIQVNTVAFYAGSLKYFRGRHLLYAIPAIAFILTIVILPPILLLVYPLCYKVFSLLRIQESKFTRILCRIIPLERLKPFFDSFQGCFKDECRYFSGLYFIYRLSTLVTFASLQNLSLYYIAVEIQFVLMFIAHAWNQPYTTAWHNKLDTVLFAILIIVNALTLFRYNHSSDTISVTTIRRIESIQIAIACLPLLYIIVYTLREVLLKLRRYCIFCRKETKGDLAASLNLSLLDHRRNEGDPRV